jgi:hypothetical protein
VPLTAASENKGDAFMHARIAILMSTTTTGLVSILKKSSQVNEKSIKTTTTMQLAVCDKQLLHKIIIPSRFKNTLLFAFSHMYLVTGVCMCA